MGKRISMIAIFLVVVLSVTIVGASPGKVNDWAVETVADANKAGIIPIYQYTGDYTLPIERSYVAELLMNAHKAYTGSEYTPKGETPFIDGDSKALAAVYELGIMNGMEETVFGYHEYVTREQMAKILLTFRGVMLGKDVILPRVPEAPFHDFDKLGEWAKPYVAAAYEEGLINGHVDGRFGGKELVTWEMAITLIMRSVRFEQRQAPEILSPAQDSMVLSGTELQVQVVGEGEITLYGIKSGTGNQVQTLGSSYGTGSISVGAAVFKPNSVYYLYADQGGVFSEPVKVFTDSYNLNVTYDTTTSLGECRISWEQIPGVETYTVTVTETRDSRYKGDIPPRTVVYEVKEGDGITIPAIQKRMYEIEINAGPFSDSHSFQMPRIWPEDADTIESNYPTSKAAADALQEEITVPVWRIDKNGEKYQSTATFKVHHMIADKVKLIFEEIFHGPEKFPFKDIGGYAWRGGRTEHNGGTAIDLNANENYCIYNNGTAIGSYWKPYEDQYSITPYGDVINAFEKYGFTWGGDSWSNPKDYMHFSYLGT